MPEEGERERLAKVIRQWNIHRLDLFEISQPDEMLGFHGVMRFYLEDHVGGNVATKCLRVCSSSSTRELIETLSEKFRPDMKMLMTSYSLYEIHANKERKLDLDERPLVVQLNWTTGNREGRFVLKKDKESSEENCQELEKGGVIQTFKRTLSRKEKKKEKNKTKASDKDSEDETGSTEKPPNNSGICESRCETKKHYSENKKQQKQAVAGEGLAGSLHPDFSDQPGLPVEIKFSGNSVDALLSAVINYTNSSTVHFKLSPAYILYAVGRFALRSHHKRGSPTSGHTHGVTQITNKMAAMTGKVIQRQKAIAGALAFWMANSSELLNFLKHDKNLSPLTQQSQQDLSHLVHSAYSFLLQCLQNELRTHLPTFLIDPEQHGPLPAGIEMVLNTLMNSMSLLRRCRVNPALTIQLFSQLFHFISAWLFNRLMGPEADSLGLHSHYWGAALRQRLMAIESWAERQGLELAADCHLGHIVQATMLLTMNKYSLKDVKDIQNSCFKLNSLQLHMLLAGYLYANNEPHIPPDLINAVVAAAEASTDNMIRSEGRDVQLEQSLDLRLPFLLSEGGYSCDTVRGIPPGFREFLEPICQKGICSITSVPDSKGNWTVHFREPPPSLDCMAGHRELEVVVITLNKPLNCGLGISIVAAKGAGQDNLGIYIKSIVKGGPAEMNGRLAAGDQLLKVDGQSLVGLSQERAAAIIIQTGPVVTLKVAKFGARYHGLGSLLSERTAEHTTGDESHSNPNSKAFTLESVALNPSEHLHGNSKRKKDQIMQRNRQLYRSNPNVTTGFDDRLGPVGPAVKVTNIADASSVNLCANTYHREYLTLPTPKSQDRTLAGSNRAQQTSKVSLTSLDAPSSSKRTLMRQALSQENLCIDEQPNLWEQKDQQAKQTMSHYSSFPIRSSVSAHDILSDNCSPPKQQQGCRPSGADVWRSPVSQPPAPMHSIQPIRIDIPVTRAVRSQTKPPLTTFQSPSFLSVKMSQTLKVKGNRQNQDHLIYACPIPVTKKPPQPSLLSQQHRSTTPGGQTAKPQAGTTPIKHVSFQEPPNEQEQGLGRAKQKDPQRLSDPWRREAKEKLEKQQRLHVVELLEQEVQELQAKANRTVEENNRLRKQSLEWQFQKRLQEIQRRGDDEEEDEEGDEDLNMMLTMQQLEERTQNRRTSVGNINTDPKALEEQSRNHLSQTENKAKTEKRR